MWMPIPWQSALRRYLGIAAVGNLAWEFAHLPFYTIWRSGGWDEIAFAALHCTGGDILIAVASLTAALLLFGSNAWPLANFAVVAVTTVGLGVTYAAFSEWLNIVRRAAWAYSELMPTIPVFGFNVGLSPLLQWIVVPSIGFIAVSKLRRANI